MSENRSKTKLHGHRAPPFELIKERLKLIKALNSFSSLIAKYRDDFYSETKLNELFFVLCKAQLALLSCAQMDQEFEKWYKTIKENVEALQSSAAGAKVSAGHLAVGFIADCFVHAHERLGQGVAHQHNYEKFVIELGGAVTQIVKQAEAAICKPAKTEPVPMAEAQEEEEEAGGFMPVRSLWMDGLQRLSVGPCLSFSFFRTDTEQYRWTFHFSPKTCQLVIFHDADEISYEIEQLRCHLTKAIIHLQAHFGSMSAVRFAVEYQFIFMLFVHLFLRILLSSGEQAARGFASEIKEMLEQLLSLLEAFLQTESTAEFLAGVHFDTFELRNALKEVERWLTESYDFFFCGMKLHFAFNFIALRVFNNDAMWTRVQKEDFYLEDLPHLEATAETAFIPSFRVVDSKKIRVLMSNLSPAEASFALLFTQNGVMGDAITIPLLRAYCHCALRRSQMPDATFASVVQELITLIICMLALLALESDPEIRRLMLDEVRFLVVIMFETLMKHTHASIFYDIIRSGLFLVSFIFRADLSNFKVIVEKVMETQDELLALLVQQRCVPHEPREGQERMIRLWSDTENEYRVRFQIPGGNSYEYTLTVHNNRLQVHQIQPTHTHHHLARDELTNLSERLGTLVQAFSITLAQEDFSTIVLLAMLLYSLHGVQEVLLRILSLVECRLTRTHERYLLSQIRLLVLQSHADYRTILRFLVEATLGTCQPHRSTLTRKTINALLRQFMANKLKEKPPLKAKPVPMKKTEIIVTKFKKLAVKLPAQSTPMRITFTGGNTYHIGYGDETFSFSYSLTEEGKLVLVDELGSVFAFTRLCSYVLRLSEILVALEESSLTIEEIELLHILLIIIAIALYTDECAKEESKLLEAHITIERLIRRLKFFLSKIDGVDRSTESLDRISQLLLELKGEPIKTARTYFKKYVKHSDDQALDFETCSVEERGDEEDTETLVMDESTAASVTQHGEGKQTTRTFPAEKLQGETEEEEEDEEDLQSEPLSEGEEQQDDDVLDTDFTRRMVEIGGFGTIYMRYYRNVVYMTRSNAPMRQLELPDRAHTVEQLKALIMRIKGWLMQNAGSVPSFISQILELLFFIGLCGRTRGVSLMEDIESLLNYIETCFELTGFTRTNFITALNSDEDAERIVLRFLPLTFDITCKRKEVKEAEKVMKFMPQSDDAAETGKEPLKCLQVGDKRIYFTSASDGTIQVFPQCDSTSPLTDEQLMDLIEITLKSLLSRSTIGPEFLLSITRIILIYLLAFLSAGGETEVAEMALKTLLAWLVERAPDAHNSWAEIFRAFFEQLLAEITAGTRLHYDQVTSCLETTFTVSMQLGSQDGSSELGIVYEEAEVTEEPLEDGSRTLTMTKPAAHSAEPSTGDLKKFQAGNMHFVFLEHAGKLVSFYGYRAEETVEKNMTRAWSRNTISLHARTLLCLIEIALRTQNQENFLTILIILILLYRAYQHGSSVTPLDFDFTSIFTRIQQQVMKSEWTALIRMYDQIHAMLDELVNLRMSMLVQRYNEVVQKSLVEATEAAEKTSHYEEVETHTTTKSRLATRSKAYSRFEIVRRVEQEDLIENMHDQSEQSILKSMRGGKNLRVRILKVLSTGVHHLFIILGNGEEFVLVLDKLTLTINGHTADVAAIRSLLRKLLTAYEVEHFLMERKTLCCLMLIYYYLFCLMEHMEASSCQEEVAILSSLTIGELAKLNSFVGADLLQSFANVIISAVRWFNKLTVDERTRRILLAEAIMGRFNGDKPVARKPHSHTPFKTTFTRAVRNSMVVERETQGELIFVKLSMNFESTGLVRLLFTCEKDVFHCFVYDDEGNQVQVKEGSARMLPESLKALILQLIKKCTGVRSEDDTKCFIIQLLLLALMQEGMTEEMACQFLETNVMDNDLLARLKQPLMELKFGSMGSVFKSLSK